MRALQGRQKVLGAEHPHTLSSMKVLAATYRDSNRLIEAEALELQALKLMKRFLEQSIQTH